MPYVSGATHPHKPLVTHRRALILEGLSPQLSDYGDHSNELETTPREAKILRAGYSVGLSIDFDDKNSCIVVKSVSKGGAVGRDGSTAGLL